MLRILQISFFLILAIAICAFSVWRYFHGGTWWLAAIVALGGFAALLSGYFLGSSDEWHHKFIKFFFEFVLSNIPRAVIANAFILIITIVLFFFALRAKPAESDYFEVRVFNKADIPSNYQIGSKVTLHTRTDGLTHQELVGRDGGAVFWEIPSSTNFVYQVDVLSSIPPFTTGGSEKINRLPDLMKIDIANISMNNRQSLSNIEPEAAISLRPIPSNYLKNIDERGSINLQFANAPWGVPQAELILNRLGYVLGYSLKQKLLSWVAYSIFPTDQVIPRTQNFKLDPAIPEKAQASNADYTGSGFDRGHMISPADMFFKGAVVVEEAFYLSTIAPQTPYLNRNLWRDLEVRVRKEVLKNQQPAYVIAGPLFLTPSNNIAFKFETIGDGQILVPTHFFRIIIMQFENKIKSFAFIVPNSLNEIDLKQCLVSISEVETKSSLNFFPLMEPQLANFIKKNVGELW